MRKNFNTKSAKAEYTRFDNLWTHDFRNRTPRSLSEEERAALAKQYTPPGSRFEIWEKKAMDKLIEEMSFGE